MGVKPRKYDATIPTTSTTRCRNAGDSIQLAWWPTRKHSYHARVRKRPSALVPPYQLAGTRYCARRSMLPSNKRDVSSVKVLMILIHHELKCGLQDVPSCRTVCRKQRIQFPRRALASSIHAMRTLETLRTSRAYRYLTRAARPTHTRV
jgi:hypothetical protein